MGGIYLIENTVSGRCYIGSTIDLDRRLKRHRYDLRRRRHDNPHLQRAWNKYGPEAFSFAVLEEVTDADELPVRERAHLDANMAPKYNLGPCARAPRLGMKNTPAQRAKISAALKGRERSVEHRAALSAARKGWKPTPENLEKLIASNRGRKLSPAHIEKVRAKHVGQKRTSVALERMRAAFRSRTPYHPTTEHRAKLSAVHSQPRPHMRGRKRSPEHTAKLVAANTGKKRTP